MRTDPTGEAWWHWAIAAAVVAVCAVAVVATAGGAAAGIAAIAAVGSGMAASTTASTVAAAAFIGSATCLAVSALNAASESNSVSDFNSQGNWTTVATTVGGAIVGGAADMQCPKHKLTKLNKTTSLFYRTVFILNMHLNKARQTRHIQIIYNNYTGKYEKSTAYYDFAGRQSIRIDWTTFYNVSRFRFEELSVPLEMYGFEIINHFQDGWEKDSAYEIRDFENGHINFFCESFKMGE